MDERLLHSRSCSLPWPHPGDCKPPSETVHYERSKWMPVDIAGEVRCNNCKQLAATHKGEDCDPIYLLSNLSYPEYEQVNHPPHYNSHPSGIECIVVVQHMPFNIGNAIKYLWRAGLKENAPTEQDYDKAIWYINQEKKRLKNG